MFTVFPWDAELLSSSSSALCSVCWLSLVSVLDFLPIPSTFENSRSIMITMITARTTPAIVMARSTVGLSSSSSSSSSLSSSSSSSSSSLLRFTLRDSLTLDVVPFVIITVLACSSRSTICTKSPSGSTRDCFRSAIRSPIS